VKGEAAQRAPVAPRLAECLSEAVALGLVEAFLVDPPQELGG
jgi:hypothetical protein